MCKTKIVDVVAALDDYGIRVTIYDPQANLEEVRHEYNLECHLELPNVITSGVENFEDFKNR